MKSECSVLDEFYNHLCDTDRNDVADLVFNVFSWSDDHAIKKMKRVLWRAIKNGGAFEMNWIDQRTNYSRLENLKSAFEELDVLGKPYGY